MFANNLNRRVFNSRTIQNVYLHSTTLRMGLRNPVVVSKQPYECQLIAGKKYSWCSCGFSKNQPFCDGSHKKTGMRPVRMTADETCQVYFCGCKQTKTPPYCDGTHMTDAVQTCELGKPLQC